MLHGNPGTDAPAEVQMSFAAAPCAVMVLAACTGMHAGRHVAAATQQPTENVAQSY